MLQGPWHSLPPPPPQYFLKCLPLLALYIKTHSRMQEMALKHSSFQNFGPFKLDPLEDLSPLALVGQTHVLTPQISKPVLSFRINTASRRIPTVKDCATDNSCLICFLVIKINEFSYIRQN